MPPHAEPPLTPRFHGNPLANARRCDCGHTQATLVVPSLIDRCTIIHRERPGGFPGPARPDESSRCEHADRSGNLSHPVGFGLPAGAPRRDRAGPARPSATTRAQPRRVCRASRLEHCMGGRSRDERRTTDPGRSDGRPREHAVPPIPRLGTQLPGIPGCAAIVSTTAPASDRVAADLPKTRAHTRTSVSISRNPSSQPVETAHTCSHMREQAGRSAPGEPAARSSSDRRVLDQRTIPDRPVDRRDNGFE